ncbi:AAA family ATPase [Sphingobacterium spiritivorum]|uniref:AAA family ATPase n=1 Tax=Sphingobacterium spiritivorum TaxID=258 RepID=UPI003DA44DFE
MAQSLTEIAQSLKDANKKVQLIYAFNGTGKTQLSKEFKKKIEEDEGEEDGSINRRQMLYYNAFSEDLFYWKNEDDNNILKIHSNDFTNWIIRDRGQDQNIINHFQRYTNDKLNPLFEEQIRVINVDGRPRNQSFYPEVTFSYLKGTERFDNIKISKAEERCFIWSVFYTLFVEIVEILKYTEEDRDEETFNNLKYIFIDDPVSSLDDNHLIELAVDVATLVKSCESKDLKFIITTHNPLFYNVISNELNNKYPNKNPKIIDHNGSQKEWLYKEDQSCKYRLVKMNDGTYNLSPLGRSTPFSYHLSLLFELQKVKQTEEVQKYHFNFLRNILEKTATFLGHSKWENLLPLMSDGSRDPFANRILNLSSHSAHAGEEIAEVQDHDKTKFIELINFLESEYKFFNLIERDGTV